MRRPGGGARALWRASKPGIRAAAMPFVLSRAIVVLCVALAHYLVDDLAPRSQVAAGAAHSGLLGWDAAWYRKIAAHGYAGLGKGALRFFPLLPILSRTLGAIPGIDPGVGLLIVANVSTFVALVLLYRLVRFEVPDEHVATRAVWVLALAPSAFVLVMGYAESLLLVCTLVFFLGLRQRRYDLAVAGAFLAGLCRPVGLLLVVPAIIEGARNWRGARTAERVHSVAAGLAAPIGTAAYLTWVQITTGLPDGFFLPFREQLTSTHRGFLADPVVTIVHDASDFVHGVHLGTAQHAPWAVVLVLLAGYLCRKLPLSYGAYAIATLAVALSAPNLDSLERYGLACFPFAIAVALCTGRRTTWWALLAVSGALLAAYSMLTFLGAYVP